MKRLTVVRRALRPRLFAVIALAAVAGCSVSTGPLSNPPIRLQMTTNRGVVSPGDTLLVELTAQPVGGRSLSYVKLAASGAFTASDSVQGVGTQTVVITRPYVIPANATTGTILLTGSAQATDGATARLELPVTLAPPV